MANKIVKIPVADISELQSDGKYILRYRVASKDRRRVSDWSQLHNLSFPLNQIGQVSSFYELYVKTGRPILDDGTVNSNDPHPSNAYSISVITAAMDVNLYITSNITYAEDDSKMYTYSWKSLSSYPIHQEFDVYLSWNYATSSSTSAWGNWVYAGTTTSNTFNFRKPDSTAQAVQAAVFLSSYPKLTNIFDNEGEVTFISMSDPFSTFQDVGTSTLGTVTTPPTGGWYATISSISVPVPTNSVGRRLFDDGTRFANKVVRISSVNAAPNVNTITVKSDSAITSGSLTNLRL